MTSILTHHRKQAGPADGELVMSLSELVADKCPQQLFDCPFSFPSMDELQDPDSDRPSTPAQLQSQLSDECTGWACEDPPSHRDDDHGFLNSCFYQLHMDGRPFVSDGPSCGTAGGGAHRLQVEFSLPSTSASSSAVLSSSLQAFGSLLHP